MSYTKTELEDLPRKADVLAVAEELGLDTDGTRAEVTARIIASQEPPADGGDPGVDEVVVEETPAPAEVPRAHGEDGRFVADNGGTQPDESVAPAYQARELHPKIPEQVKRLAEAYFGAGKVTASAEKEILAALEIGHQPCIVRGSGNVKFAVKVFATVFDKNDKSKDAVDASIKLNIARRLAHAGLYPTRG